MLSIFPIQFLAPLAYTILRVVVGIVLIYLGLQHRRQRDSLRSLFPSPSWLPATSFVTGLYLFEWLTALLLITGTFTQVAALVVAVMSFIFFCWHRRLKHKTIPSRLFYLLLLAATLTLTITGAGAIAVDLPI